MTKATTKAPNKGFSNKKITYEYVIGFGLDRSENKHVKVGLSETGKFITSTKANDRGKPGELRTVGSSVWKCLGLSKNGGATNWLLVKGEASIGKNTQDSHKNKNNNPKQYKPVKEASKLPASGDLLPIEERDKWFRKLRDHNPLTAASLQYLIDIRGLTSDKAFECFTLGEHSSKITGMPSNFPGLKPNSKFACLTITETTQNGKIIYHKPNWIALPVKDYQGRIQGVQLTLESTEFRKEIKNRKQAGSKFEGDGKYKWLSFNSNYLLAETGKQPIAYNYPDKPLSPKKNNFYHVGICEGTLKPMVAAKKHNMRFLSIANCQFYSAIDGIVAGLEQIQEEINAAHLANLAEKFKGKARDVVRKRIQAESLESNGKKLNIADREKVLETRQSEVEQIAQEFAEADNSQPRKVIPVFTPDAGFGVNANVRNPLLKAATELELKGYDPRIMYWGQLTKCRDYKLKKAGDVDEIGFSLEHFLGSNSTKKKTLQELRRLASSGELLEKQRLASERNQDALAAAKDFGYNTIIKSARWMSDIIDWSRPEFQVGEYLIKGHMGTGKTETLRDLPGLMQAEDNADEILLGQAIAEIEANGKTVTTGDLLCTLPPEKQYLAWHFNDQRTVRVQRKVAIWGARRGLISQTADTVGARNRNDLVRNGEEIDFTFDNSIALCLDSLLDLDPKDFYRATIIIDEVVACLYHLFYGGTCEKKRPQLIKRFTEILHTVASSGGRIILMDANLDRLTFEAIETIFKSWGYSSSSVRKYFPRTFIQNNYLPSDRKYTVDFIPGEITSKGNINEYMPTPVIEDFKASVGKELSMLMIDSKAQANAIHMELIKKYPKKKGLLITGDTVDEVVSCFLKKPEQFLADGDISWIITTNVIESGLSITGEYIKSVYGIFYGVVSVDGAFQMLGRVRWNGAKRTIWATPLVNTKSVGRADNLSEQQISRFKNAEETLTQMHRNFSEVCSLIKTDEELSRFKDELVQLQAKLNRRQALDDAANVINSELKVKTLREEFNYAVYLLRKLEKAQYTVRFRPEKVYDTGLANSIRENKDLYLWLEAGAIASAPVIPFAQAQVLANSDLSQDRRTKRSVDRAFLKHQLNDREDLITQNYVYHLKMKKRGETLRQAQNYAEVSHPDLLIQKTKDTYLYHLGRNKLYLSQNPKKSNEGAICLGDVSIAPLKNKAMHDFGITRFIQHGSKHSEESILQWAKAISSYDYHKQRELLNVWVKDDSIKSALIALNKILSKIGLVLLENDDGYIVQYAQSVEEDSLREEEWEEILKAVTARLKESADEARESIGKLVLKENKNFDFHEQARSTEKSSVEEIREQ